MKNIGVLFFLFLSFSGFGHSDSLTGLEILNRSIEHCGGEEAISKIETTNLSYVFLTGDNAQVSIVENRVIGKKYGQSVLSEYHTPKSTFFDGEKLTVVNGTEIVSSSVSKNADAIQLKTYNHLQYGYKKLGYAINRLPDEKFNHFDCFVLEATSQKGYSTINFFDKTNFRLIMVVYPGGNKSIMSEFKFVDGILFNSEILNTSVEKEITRLRLLKVENNRDIPDLWFSCPYMDQVIVPDYIKVGEFRDIEGKSILKRTLKKQVEYSESSPGETELKVEWSSNDVFILKEKSSNKNQSKLIHDIRVRIISWSEKGYVCHYLYGNSFGTQTYVISD